MDEKHKILISCFLCFQQPSNMKDTQNASSTKANIKVLDLDCSKELHITRLDDHKPDPTVTYRIETDLLKQISNILFHTHHR